MKTRKLLVILVSIIQILAVCLLVLFISRESPQRKLAKEFLSQFFTVSDFAGSSVSRLNPGMPYGSYLNEKGMKQILENRWGTLLGNVAAKDRCNITTESLILEEYGSGYEGRAKSKLLILQKNGYGEYDMTRFNYRVKLKAYYPDSLQEKEISLCGAINIKKENDGYRIDYLKITPLGLYDLFSLE